MRLPILFFLLTAYSIKAQFISGKVLDASTKQPLPYVNIGIINKNLGTVSDEYGDFSLELNPELLSDTLRFSMIGYGKKDFVLRDYLAQEKAENVILLNEEALLLEGVTVIRKKNKKYRRKILGNKTESKTLVGGFTSNDLGNEIGFICRIRQSPTFLETFNLSIAKNSYGNIRFRLNFYSLRNGMPDQNILNEMIMIETDIESGMVSVDLRPYDIVMEDDFLVAIEWIEDLGNGELLFSAGFFGSNLFARATSQGTWTQMGVAAYGMNVEVVY
jgi:hypothetical protein